MRGMFITVEGSEGAGKSTNLAFIESYLRQQGRETLVTREPGGTELGEQIRTLLLGHRHDGMANDTELLLVFAARAEHLAKVVRPALEAGTWVLCDRFTDASYAYQGGGRGVPSRRIEALESWVQGELQPDLTILLDVPVDVGMTRAGQRSAPDRFESQQQAFFERVRGTYLARASTFPERFRIVDASQSLTAVQADLRQALDGFLQSQDAGGGDRAR